MSHAPQEEGPRPNPVNSPWRAVIFAFGGVGLLGAMFTDAIAVVGRQLRMPFLGSVEMAQVCVIMIGGASLVAATLLREHANVRVITERLPLNWRRGLQAFANLMNGLFFALLLTGSAWIAWELRDGAEHTELLDVPVAPLRVYWLVCAGACALILVGQAFVGRKTP